MADDSILNANIPLIGRIGGKLVDINRAHIARGQAYSRRLYTPSETSAQKFFASTMAEHTTRQTSFPHLAEIQKKREEYEDWWKNAPLSKAYTKLSGAVVADKIASGVADSSSLQRARDAAYEKGDSEYEIRQARSAIAQASRKREARLRIGTTRNSEDRREQKNTQIGIEKALGGGKVMRVMRTMFGYNFGVANILHTLGRFTIGKSLSSASSVNQTYLRSLAAGTSYGSVYGLGGIARVFGGSENDAAALYGSINRLRTGALMGNGMGPLASAIKYGAVVHPFMSEEQILYAIADAYQRQGLRGPGFQATMAGELGIGPWAQRAFSGGAAGLKAYMDKYAPSLSESQRRRRIEQNDAQNELGVAWDQFWNETIVVLTPILKEITRYLKNAYGKSAYRHELEDYTRRNPNATPDQVAKYINSIGLGEFIPKKVAGKNLHFANGGMLSAIPMLLPEEVDNPIYDAYQKLEKNNLQSVSPYSSANPFSSNIYNLNFNSSADPQAIADKVVPAFKDAVNSSHANSVINVTVGGMNAAYSIER